MARKDDLKVLIKQTERQLDKFREQLPASGSSPPEFLMQTKDLEHEVNRLREELEFLENADTVTAKDGAASAPTVFISYSHKDELEKEELMTHLRVLERAGIFKLWVDDQIAGGADWFKEIEQAISEANVVILLISNNFLLSDFIASNEVPAALERREEEGITVFPIIAKYCGWWAFDWLNKMNVRPKNGLPIWRSEGTPIDKELYEISREIAFLVRRQQQT
jgi:hypothetical protein